MNTNFLINFFLNVDKKKKSINRTISLLILFKVHSIAYLNFVVAVVVVVKLDKFAKMLQAIAENMLKSTLKHVQMMNLFGIHAHGHVDIAIKWTVTVYV